MIRTRRVLGGVILTAIAAASVLISSPASGASNLSSVVLDQAFPGFVASPPGSQNGPVTQSNIGEVIGGSSATDAQFARQLATGDFSGYLREWVHEPANGDGVLIAGLQFRDPTEASSFAMGVSSTIQRQANAAPFTVSNVPGADGYTVRATPPGGQPLTEYAVLFSKGNAVFQLVVLTESGDLTSADAIALANRQWAIVPTPINWTPIVRGASLIGGIVLSVVIVLAARRRRYPSIFTSGFSVGNGLRPRPSAVTSLGPGQ